MKVRRITFNLLVMQSVSQNLKNLSRARQIVLAGSLLSLFSIFMPWHTIGTAVLGTENSYNGFGDQNLIIGVITLVCMLLSLAVVALPLFGIRFPRIGWRDSSLVTFLGGESTLLVFVLTIMHATSLTRAANYELRLGIHLALVGTVFVFFGGYLLKNEEQLRAHSHAEPIAHLPRRPQFGSQIDLRDDPEKTKEDARMRLDI